MVIMMKLEEIIHNHDEVILIKENRLKFKWILTYLEQNEMDIFYLLNSINKHLDYSSKRKNQRTDLRSPSLFVDNNAKKDHKKFV
jgi:hypothetical protein